MDEKNIIANYRSFIQTLSNSRQVFSLLGQLKAFAYLRIKELNPEWSDREISKRVGESNTSISRLIKKYGKGGDN